MVKAQVVQELTKSPITFLPYGLVKHKSLYKLMYQHPTLTERDRLSVSPVQRVAGDWRQLENVADKE